MPTFAVAAHTRTHVQDVLLALHINYYTTYSAIPLPDTTFAHNTQLALPHTHEHNMTKYYKDCITVLGAVSTVVSYAVNRS